MSASKWFFSSKRVGLRRNWSTILPKLWHAKSKAAGWYFFVSFMMITTLEK